MGFHEISLIPGVRGQQACGALWQPVAPCAAEALPLLETFARPQLAAILSIFIDFNGFWWIPKQFMVSKGPRLGPDAAGVLPL